MSMKYILIFLFFSFDAFCAVSSAQLISSFKSAEKDSTINIGIKISLQKGWHTYWKNPGDIGQTLKVTWNLPSLVDKPTPLKWPRPKRILYNQWTNFGYTQDLLVTSSVKIPSLYKEKILPIKAYLSWLVCKDVCIPFEKKLSLHIPIKKNKEINYKIHKYFEKTKKNQNIKSDLKGLITKNQLEIISSQKFEFIDFFPLDSLPSKKPKIYKQNPTHYILTLPIDKKIIKTHALVVFKKKEKIQSSIISFSKKKKEIPFMIFLMAFLGGLILNFMPCVLPIVFLKFYHATKENPQSLLISSLFYAGGLISSFLFLALSIHFLSGEGWGFQMQSPLFIVFLILFFTFLGFNFLGLFHIPKFTTSIKWTSSKKLENFFAGFLTTTAASPCTAPFMGVAIGYAFSQSTPFIVATFTSLGLGMACPYLVLGFFPKLLKKWPKPGIWSEKLKKSMAFPMFATTAWLFHILINLQSSWAFPILMSLLGYSFVLWIKNSKLKIIKIISAFVLVISLFLNSYPFFQKKQNEVVIENFSIFKLDQMRNENKYILLNFTADWCITCQINEWSTFRNKKIQKFLKENKILILKGDWTSKNDEISQILKKYGRAGIPFTLFFPPENDPVILPEILTPNILIKTLSHHL